MCQCLAPAIVKKLQFEIEVDLPDCREMQGGHHGGHFSHGMTLPEETIGKWRPLPEGVASRRNNVMANGSTEQQVGLLSSAFRPALRKPQPSLYGGPC